MATQSACFTVTKSDQSPATPAQDTPSNNQQEEYDFVEEPDQDCFCPVSLELLLDPYLTSCCGHHISQQAASRLTREKKPCPMCKERDFVAHVDKYFKRNTINKLKVYCPHKNSGCEWVGELGDLDHHLALCPKRPWKCQYCDFESNYETGPKEHTPICTKYPLPCPNQCEIGTVPRCDAEKHLLVCPLQVVECEFANAGCDVKLLRKDLAKHMTENAQHHLMSATLLNLRTTRELHQKMEEKDQQIMELKQQMAAIKDNINSRFQQMSKDTDTKLQEQTDDIEANLQRQILAVERKSGYIRHEFRKCQKAGDYRDWHSAPFPNSPRGYKFKLYFDICNDGNKDLFRAFLCIMSSGRDEQKWPVKVTVHLEMLNQRGDHDHYTTGKSLKYDRPTGLSIYQSIDSRFCYLEDLKFNAKRDTEYLKDDYIKLVLWLRIE